MHGRACLLHAGALEADKATEIQDAVRWDLRAKRAGVVKEITSLVSVRRRSNSRSPLLYAPRSVPLRSRTSIISLYPPSGHHHFTPAWRTGPKGSPICAAPTYTTVAVRAKLVVRLVALIHDLLEEAVGRRERLLHSSGRHPRRPPPSGAQKRALLPLGGVEI